ncbi:HET-domain-containing protein [Neofusicoccum parvum]|nr:HET-domain-containing protein [Neofusicoccum parvum]
MLPISPRLPEFYKKTYFPFHYDWHFWNGGLPPFSDKEMIGFNIRGVKTLIKFAVGTIKVQMNLRRRGSGQSWHAFDPDELHSPDRIRKLYDRLLLGDTSKQRRPWHARLRAFFMRWSLLLAAAFAVHRHFHPSLLSLWLFYFASIAGLKLVYCAALAVRSINARPSERDPSIPAAWRPMALEAGRNELWGLACEIQNAVDRASWNRLLFVTDNGYIGIGPLNTEPGDEVFSLVGGHVPHVLKRRSEGEQVFAFKGESYVHGIMDGELWPDPEVWRDLEKMKKQAVRIILI